MRRGIDFQAFDHLNHLRQRSGGEAEISGKVSHSACQWPMPRSFSCGIAASKVETRPGTRSAADKAIADPTGLRFCGIAEEPPRPSAAGSNTSAISVCISSETSRAILPRVPVSKPQKAPTSVTRSRSACQGRSGTPRFRSFSDGDNNVQRLGPQRSESSGGASELKDQHTRAQLAEAGAMTLDRAVPTSNL